ncbi:Isochorismatase hydrolase [Cylindrobasidium torrendii FP15055 ss-10]|uniref:Isochorismatase hydrolase n=1 Tax=Cylindrobasidium torrendii FP15055 ss-10 TaxID=1314674 RepID=A0A0D7AYX0_9AGAR|nr:Isochorismatase hydrolase [Cylindrobasidium torrendii FP15055 ss-10]
MTLLPSWTLVALHFVCVHAQFREDNAGNLTFGSYYNYWDWDPSSSTFDLTRGNTDDSKTISVANGEKFIVISPANSALVIIDMQNYFLNSDYSGQNFTDGLNAVAPTIEAVKAFRTAGAKVIWCQWGLNEYDLRDIGPAYKYGFAATVDDVKDPSASLGSEMGEYGGVDYGRKLVDGYYNTEPYGPLAHLMKEGLEAGTDLYFPKNRQSCMWGAQTPMGIYVEANLISTLFFSGVNIDQCVYGSFNDAYYKGYDAIIVQDCSATTSPPAATEMVLYNADKHGFVTNSSDIVAGMGI